MSVRPDTTKTTVTPTVEKMRRAPRPIHRPRWLVPVAVAALITAGVGVGISQLDSGDDTATTVSEPLVVPEEQQYIDEHTASVSRSAVVRSTEVPILGPPTGLNSLIGVYERDYIEARSPGALLPYPAPMVYPELMGPDEQAWVRGEYLHPDATTADWCETHTPC